MKRSKKEKVCCKTKQVMDFQSEAHADATSEIKDWVVGDEEPKPI